MMLVEQTATPKSSLPITQFKEHLRLGTGFADDGTQDALLERLLRAALKAIEARTGKILLTRGFLWSVECWRSLGGQALPVAPVSAVTSLSVTDRDGAKTVYDPVEYALIPDSHRPRLVPTGAYLPVIPADGLAEIAFQAGFGTTWRAIPVDLAQAVLMLAAHYHDNRFGDGEPSAMIPVGVSVLIQQYKTVRLLGGRA